MAGAPKHRSSRSQGTAPATGGTAPESSRAVPAVDQAAAERDLAERQRQREALGNVRFEEIRTYDDRSDRPTRVQQDISRLQARQRHRVEGTEEAALAQNASPLVAGWHSFRATDTTAGQAEDKDIAGGQAHRRRMLETLQQTRMHRAAFNVDLRRGMESSRATATATPPAPSTSFMRPAHLLFPVGDNMWLLPPGMEAIESMIMDTLRRLPVDHPAHSEPRFRSNVWDLFPDWMAEILEDDDFWSD